MELNEQPSPYMGEVKVQVKLTNLHDAEAAADGLLELDRVRSVSATGMVDTGAVRSVLPPHVAQRLGLKTRREQVVEYADGRKEAVGVVRGVIFEIMNREAEEEAYVLGDEVLIGQTVLMGTDLVVDASRGRVVPNPEHPDGPVFRV